MYEFSEGFNVEDININNKQEEITQENIKPKNHGNPILPKRTVNRLFGGYKNTSSSYSYQNKVDPLDVFTKFCQVLRHNKPVDEVTTSLHNIAIRDLGFNFTAIGLINSQSNCINLKLTDRTGNIYSTRVLTSEETNPLAQAFLERSVLNVNGTDFINTPYINKAPTVIYPLMSRGDCIGVYMAGSSKTNKKNQEILNNLLTYMTLSMINKKLSEKVDLSSNYDSLTGLRTHRDFQESLTEIIKDSETSQKPVAVVMMDIDSITKINNNLGHAKGDEVISFVAEKIKENIRKIDIAGRYGGDELAIIMPDTDNQRAIHFAKYLNHAISCSQIDDIGTIKLNIGISTYPNCSTEKDNLLVLAEQAAYISQYKKLKNGETEVISAEDSDISEEMTMGSFADVMARKNDQWNVDLEEELVNKFHKESLKSNNHMEDVVTSLAGAIDAKDPYTNNHSLSVARYAEALARAINLPDKEVDRIKLGATLHDVGKIGIPENILKKPNHLTDDEWEVMKQHPTIGAEKVLKPIKSLRDLIPMVKHHHEHWNGTGYPDKLKGDEIPLAARIVSIADAYHALISDRPYRKGLGVNKAIEILRMGADIQWDRELIRKFVIIAPSLSTKI